MLKSKTPRRDGTTHLLMSPLEFMQPSIERPVCGDQIRWFYVSSGSRVTVRPLGLQPFAQALLPAGPQDALNDRIGDFAAANGRRAMSAVL